MIEKEKGQTMKVEEFTAFVTEALLHLEESMGSYSIKSITPLTQDEGNGMTVVMFDGAQFSLTIQEDGRVEEQMKEKGQTMSKTNKIKVVIPAVDDKGQEYGYVITLTDPDKISEAIQAAEKDLGAVHVGCYWYYRPISEGSIWRLTRKEMVQYGAGLLDPRGIDFSLWCTYTGNPLLKNRPRKRVIEALKALETEGIVG